jgi:hypothetical protein
MPTRNEPRAASAAGNTGGERANKNNPSGIERRTEPRLNGARPVELHLLGLDDAAAAEALDATVVDLSCSGVGVRLCRPIPKGREFLVVFHGPTPEEVTSLIYKAVRYWQSRPREFHVGGKLVRRASRRDDPTGN